MNSHSRIVMVASLAALGVGCVHSKTAESAPAQDREAKQANAKPPATQKTGTGGAKGPAQPDKGPLLAMSPQELRRPDAKQKVIDGLAKKGFLPSTADVSEDVLSTAVRHFQESQGLAATGYTDEETASRLGIKMDTLNRQDEGRKPDPKTHVGGR